MRGADGRSAWFRQAGLLTAIPFVLLVGPALGYYLGSALDRRWAYAPGGMIGGIILGLFASARTTVQLIQQSRTPPSDHD
jgi:F0F1-type ATP synthase assembly protein I